MRKPVVVEAAVAATAAVGSIVAWAVTGGQFWPRWVLFAIGLVVAFQVAVVRAWRRPTGRRRRLAVHAAITLVLVVSAPVIWALSGGGFLWFLPNWAGYGALLGLHAWWAGRPPGRREQELARRIERLTRSRSGALDAQALELRRIERDLHDGAQARLVSLGMTIGLAESLLERDPATAATLLAEARAGTQTALDELREVMQSVHPSVLADRGLPGALQALALDLAVPVEVRCDLPGIAPPAIESALYFAVAECLANVVKHSGAGHATVSVRHQDHRLTAVVTDDGAGGAAPGGGTGLTGIARRLEAFDGMMGVVSPPGGPTSITLEVPCELSSPRTSPSSATG